MRKLTAIFDSLKRRFANFREKIIIMSREPFVLERVAGANGDDAREFDLFRGPFF